MSSKLHTTKLRLRCACAVQSRARVSFEIRVEASALQDKPKFLNCACVIVFFYNIGLGNMRGVNDSSHML